jgi:hypothetical protein
LGGDAGEIGVRGNPCQVTKPEVGWLAGWRGAKEVGRAEELARECCGRCIWPGREVSAPGCRAAHRVSARQSGECLSSLVDVVFVDECAGVAIRQVELTAEPGDPLFETQEGGAGVDCLEPFAQGAAGDFREPGQEVALGLF